MENNFAPEMTPAERLQALQDSAFKVEKGQYFKPLSEEEINERQQTHSDNSIKLMDLEEEKKNVTRSFKDQIDDIKGESVKLLTEIRSRQEERNGTIYMLKDDVNGLMLTYNEHGEFISSRRLKPSEKQNTLNFLRKAE